ncbi:MAG TPA: MFS transporter [Pseudomonadales bacterium]|jgi:MFS family permease|nr:MFS transporter [Gammaproteobacteria bacterium]MDP6025890.1 MFS transporter [Pseudomonadales bacterium]MDP6315556.1 MFS transporter [Pseudomonadales bacterium]MDP7316083.1 MFS transporter [Pseudomonadales bacterium]HJP50501.1 MFS transporter [Pseudomonadales bacterium]|tara:strand:+ start:955 stop:2316 length:1362 start_codon:yes stop_codon:yes gene_type:complete
MATEESVASESSMKKVAITSLAGTSIEWYDFFIFGTAAALVFPTAFFPNDMPEFVGLIASFSTFAVGFFARPVGGIFFGHFGDRVGRKAALVTALMLMGVATMLIGCLPTYALIGPAAPLILILLRFAQGLAVGGQWGGAMLLVTENAPRDRRGFYGAFAQAGAPVGIILANLAFLAVSAACTDEQFMSWGWRIPFLSSIILIGLSLYVQLTLEDTPAFRELQRIVEDKVKVAAETEADLPIPAQSPVIEAIRLYPKQILLAAGAFLAIQVTFYILIAFLVAYGSSSVGLGLSRDTMLQAVLISSCFQIPTLFIASAYSDRHGRRGIYMLGAVLTGAWAFAMFPLIDTSNFLLIVLAMSGGHIFVAMMYGPQAAFLAELFSTHVRYSGASLGYQLGAILGGAMAPIIATFLWSEFGTIYIAIYIALASVLTLTSVLLLTETKGTNLDDTSTPV